MQNKLLEVLEKRFGNLQMVRALARENKDELLEFLLSDSKFDEFFIRTKNAVVFKQEEFLTFSYLRVLDKSHTAYKNNLGLAQKFEKQLNLLKSNSSVVLNFPFKDCVLKGGQNRDDVKQNEIFFNEILASDEIDVLKNNKGFLQFKNKPNSHTKVLSCFDRIHSQGMGR